MCDLMWWLDVQFIFLLFTGIEVDIKPDTTPHIFRTTVSYGNSVELKCDSAADDGTVVWKRNGNDVSDLQEHNIKVMFY